MLQVSSESSVKSVFFPRSYFSYHVIDASKSGDKRHLHVTSWKYLPQDVAYTVTLLEVLHSLFVLDQEFLQPALENAAPACMDYKQRILSCFS